MTLKTPFPWFGGRGQVADLVWKLLGDVDHYVEPFAGSLAVLLRRPTVAGVETVNDLDGLIVNFWRAVKAAPDEVAKWADYPSSELDHQARHIWLVNDGQKIVDKLRADPEYFDARVAGWWVYGASLNLGSGFCSGGGPWVLHEGSVVHRGSIPNGHPDKQAPGINLSRQHLTSSGTGVFRCKRIINAGRRGLLAPTNKPLDVHKEMAEAHTAQIHKTMKALSDRLKFVRILCGDWTRLTGESVLFASAKNVGVFLDPPYVGRAELYSASTRDVAQEVYRWAANVGVNPAVRVVVCGYEGDWEPPDGWRVIPWVARRGYLTTNNRKERLWCSPYCLRLEEADITEGGGVC